jgi:hypothetical protein
MSRGVAPEVVGDDDIPMFIERTAAYICSHKHYGPQDVLLRRFFDISLDVHYGAGDFVKGDVKVPRQNA